MNELLQNFDWEKRINSIAYKVYGKYGVYVDKEEIKSATCLGVWLAALAYNNNKSNTKSIGEYICKKGFYLTVDILRSDRCIPRKVVKNKVDFKTNYYTEDKMTDGTHGIHFANFNTCDTRFNYDNFEFEWTDGLDDREKNIFKMRFVDGIEWKDIATKHGVTRTHMSRLHDALKTKLRMLFLASMVN